MKDIILVQIEVKDRQGTAIEDTVTRSRIVWTKQRRVQVEIERYEEQSDRAFAAGIMFL